MMNKYSIYLSIFMMYEFVPLFFLSTSTINTLINDGEYIVH